MNKSYWPEYWRGKRVKLSPKTPKLTVDFCPGCSTLQPIRALGLCGACYLYEREQRYVAHCRRCERIRAIYNYQSQLCRPCYHATRDRRRLRGSGPGRKPANLSKRARHAQYARTALLWAQRENLRLDDFERFLLSAKADHWKDDAVAEVWATYHQKDRMTRAGVNIRYQYIMRAIILECPRLHGLTDKTFEPLNRYIKNGKMSQWRLRQKWKHSRPYRALVGPPDAVDRLALAAASRD